MNMVRCPRCRTPDATLKYTWLAVNWYKCEACKHCWSETKK